MRTTRKAKSLPLSWNILVVSKLAWKTLLMFPRLLQSIRMLGSVRVCAENSARSPNSSNLAAANMWFAESASRKCATCSRELVSWFVIVVISLFAIKWSVLIDRAVLERGKLYGLRYTFTNYFISDDTFCCNKTCLASFLNSNMAHRKHYVSHFFHLANILIGLIFSNVINLGPSLVQPHY